MCCVVLRGGTVKQEKGHSRLLSLLFSSYFFQDEQPESRCFKDLSVVAGHCSNCRSGAVCVEFFSYKMQTLHGTNSKVAPLL